MIKGSHHTQESKEKNKKAHLGKPCSEKAKEINRDRWSGSGNPMRDPNNVSIVSERMKENNPMFNPIAREKMAMTKTGTTLSPEHKEKIREGTKEALSDPDIRRRMSESHEGVPRPQWVKDKISEGKKGQPKSEEHKRALSESRKGRFTGEDNPFYGKHHNEESKEKMRIPKSEISRIRMSCSRRGISEDEFAGFVRFEPYCPKFDEPLKENVRKFFGHKCVLCSKPARHNLTKKGKIWALSVHHVYIEKMACCETHIEEMNSLRERFPPSIARFGDLEFSEEEIKHIRMMVPLCLECHGRMGKEPDNIQYEKSTFRKFFTELILSKYNGKCFTEVIRNSTEKEPAQFGPGDSFSLAEK